MQQVDISHRLITATQKQGLNALWYEFICILLILILLYTQLFSLGMVDEQE